MSQPFALPSRLDLPFAHQLREWLLSIEGPITLNAESVQFIGAQTLQVLLAATQRQKKLNQALIIQTPSDDFMTCLTDLGTEISDITVEGSLE